MVYGFVLATMERYAEAHEFGRLALALNERGNGVLLTTRLNNVFGMTINYAQKPLRTSIPYYQRSIASGPTSGDLMFMCFSAVCLIDTRIGLGDPPRSG